MRLLAILRILGVIVGLTPLPKLPSQNLAVGSSCPTARLPDRSLGCRGTQTLTPRLRRVGCVVRSHGISPYRSESPAASAAAPVDSGLLLENLRFRYAVSGSNPPWKPLRAFDDGQKVYIQFPAGIAQGELPPLFVIGPEGDGQLVNYRFRSPYYIVDRLFGAAELRLGADKGDVVRIERTDGIAGRN